MKRTADINEILKPLKDTPYQAYLSNAVQVADILDWILSQVGMAEIWQTSFSISEEFLRRLFFLTSSLRTPKIFIKEFGDFLMSCHQHCLGVNLLVQR